jgi:predicted Ser/Thr protein kinase
MQHLGTTNDLRPGDRLGRYVIERELGRGGMGAVFVALDEHLGRRVALKIVAPGHAADVGFRVRFEREARIAATLEHPNVVPVYDVGESDGRVFIAMRLIDGHDLASEIRDRGALAPTRVARLVTQVCAALDAASRAGLVHRDVKPANVLVTGRGTNEHAYLSDFGVSRDAASESGLTATGEWLGTPDYAAPEQIEGGPVDARTDVYAVACMAFHLLTGRVPFSGATPAKIHGHLSLAPPRVSAFDPEISVAVDDVVSRGMAKDWRGRQASAGEFAREFGAAITHAAPPAEAVTAATERAPDATVRAPRVPRRPRGVSRTADVRSGAAAGTRSPGRLLAAVAILAAVLVAGVGAAVSLTGGRGAQTPSPQTVTVEDTVTTPAKPADRHHHPAGVHSDDHHDPQVDTRTARDALHDRPGRRAIHRRNGVRHGRHRADLLDPERWLHRRPAAARRRRPRAHRGGVQSGPPAWLSGDRLRRTVAVGRLCVRQPQERVDVHQRRRARLDAAALSRPAGVLLRPATRFG